MVQKPPPIWRGADGRMKPLLMRQALPRALCRQWLQLSAAQPAVSRLVASMLPLAGVLQAVADSALREPIEAALGPAPLCNVDQSWIRHGQPAHGWHQDGALHFDFMAHAGQAPPPDALLDMLTCWIALTPCGTDAPGLEWADASGLPLQLPAALSPQAVLARHPAQALVRPEMQPGDALLFDGSLLHRTHALPGMSQPRTSLELRFFRASTWPDRLAREGRMRL
jgi:hypothetical protein